MASAPSALNEIFLLGSVLFVGVFDGEADGVGILTVAHSDHSHLLCPLTFVCDMCDILSVCEMADI